MMDLSKYKGHTKERWGVVVNKTHFPSDCVTIATSNWIIARVSIGMNDNKADAQLIQDAPILLAEVERLQLEMKRIPPMKTLISSLQDEVRIQKEIIIDLKVMSRQSELDAERETNKTLTDEVERLQKLVDILTCCANCDHVYDSGIGHYCCKDHNKNSPLKETAQADDCCPHWKKEIAE
jgi:hypothetical protein